MLSLTTHRIKHSCIIYLQIRTLTHKLIWLCIVCINLVSLNSLSIPLPSVLTIFHCNLISSCIHCVFKMEITFSHKKSKSSLFSEIHPDVYVPILITTDAQSKYAKLKHNLVPGMGITFNSFPHLLTKFHSIGWESLVVFEDRHIYPSLIAEFYSHMVFNKAENGILTSIHTCIQGVDYIIDEEMLIHALQLHPTVASLPKINQYVYPMGYSVPECLAFKQNLAAVTNQLVPAFLFDFPVPIGVEFLTAESQFLARIVKKNFMPVRENANMLPFDLELMNAVLNEFMPYNLAFFLLTSFEHCYNNNCMGYGLLLTTVFKFLGINLIPLQSQLVNNSNLVSHMNLPPTPLSVFTPPSHDYFENHLHMVSHIASLNSMNQLLLHNQTTMMGQMEEMKQTIHHLKEMLHLLNEKLSIHPYHFSASQSSAHPDPIIPTPTDDLLPLLDMHLSPINLEEF